MKSVYNIEIAGKSSTAKEIEQNLHSYKVYNHTQNNSLMLTATFGRWTKSGDHLPRMAADFARFMDLLLQVAQVKKEKVAYWGYLLIEPVPHVHAVVYSTRDRVTGRTVARIKEDQIRLLEGTWKTSGYDSVKLQRLYDLEGLVHYLADRNNLSRPGQRWLPIKSHNLQLLQEKSLRKAA